MIDTHAHIDSDQFADDRKDMIKRAFDNGMLAIVVPSIHPGNFDAVRSLADTYDNIFRGIGVHPHNAHEATHKIFDTIERQTEDEKVVAVGEIGIDYYYDFSPKETQKTVFREQLRIAKRTGLPAIIHNREADEDVLKIIEEEQDGTLRGVLHCFSSDEQILERALALGMNVSFTGNITYKKSVLGDVVKRAPLDKLMIETDCPYMTPVPHRGKRNEPMFVRHVAEKIAELHETTLEQVLTMTTNNALSFFKILLCLFIVLGYVSTTEVYAQKKKTKNDQYNDRDEEEDEEKGSSLPSWWQKKSIGVAFTLSTNTIVEAQTGIDTNRRSSLSYEGLLAYGGGVTYSLLDWLNVEASYLYSKNNKVTETQKDSKGDPLPNTHQSINLSVRAIANPYAKVNFFGTVGFSYLTNKIWAGKIAGIDPDDQLMKTVNQVGMNFGAGFSVNIPFSFGLFQPTAEWRLDFPFQTETRLIATRRDEPNNPSPRRSFEVSTFYSLPRFTLYFYPKW